jgi:hypothetical protein
MLKLLGLKKSKKIKTVCCNTIHYPYVHTKQNRVYTYDIINIFGVLTNENWGNHISPEIAKSFKKSLELVITGYCHGYRQIVVHCDTVNYTGIFSIKDSKSSSILEILLVV